MLQASKVDSKVQRLQRTEPEFVFKCPKKHQCFSNCQEETEDKYDEKLHGKPNVRTPAIYVIPGTVGNDMDHNTPLSGSRRLDSRSST